MNFLLTNMQTLHEAKGMVVVIDVLRAFSTTCYCFQNNAEKIFAAETIEQALLLKKQYPKSILIGERKGLPIEGFDYTNSPAQIKDIDFTGKSIILTTTAGTKGIALSTNSEETITGAFINSNAIISYIKQKNPSIVSFVCTDDSYYDNEDYLCASYLKSLLEDKPRSFAAIKTYLTQHPCTDGFIRKPYTKYSIEDFSLCMEADKFNFVIKANRINGRIELEKISL